MYGSSTPPEYNLSKVTAPVNIFGSKDDKTAIDANTYRLRKKLPNVKFYYRIKDSKFTHLDFIYSRYVRVALNNVILKKINAAHGKSNYS